MRRHTRRHNLVFPDQAPCKRDWALFGFDILFLFEAAFWVGGQGWLVGHKGGGHVEWPVWSPRLVAPHIYSFVTLPLLSLWNFKRDFP